MRRHHVHAGAKNSVWSGELPSSYIAEADSRNTGDKAAGSRRKPEDSTKVTAVNGENLSPAGEGNYFYYRAPGSKQVVVKEGDLKTLARADRPRRQ